MQGVTWAGRGRDMWRSLGPAMARVTTLEALRASLGALVGDRADRLFLLSPEIDTEFGLYLVAPFGASAVMVFAIPNSPLAQPWSVIVGNMLGALIGVSMCYPCARSVVARGAGGGGRRSFAMALLRALHPPAGGVAMAAALHPEEIFPLGFWFVLTPIGLGAVSLVSWRWPMRALTGRIYPFRQYRRARAARRRAGGQCTCRPVGRAVDRRLLERYRQSFNLGAADLARLIGAAQMEAAAQSTGPLDSADIMSPDPSRSRPTRPGQGGRACSSATASPHCPWSGRRARYAGIIFQIDLIARASRDAGCCKGTVRRGHGAVAGAGGAGCRNSRRTSCAAGRMGVAPTRRLRRSCR